MDVLYYAAASFALGLGTNLLLRRVFKKQQEDSLVEGYISISTKANALIAKKRANQGDIDPDTGRISRKNAIKRIDGSIKNAHAEDEISVVAILNPVDFHKVNEAYGFENGDKIILEMYKRLRDYLLTQKDAKEGATIAVTESANFLLFMPVGMEVNDVNKHLTMMGELIKEPIDLDGKTVNIVSNIGYVVVPIEIDVGEDAYLTLEKISKRGMSVKSSISTVDDIQEPTSHKSAIIEDMIVRALDEDTIEAHVQPIVNTTTKTIEAAEVLSRMRVDGEVITPSAFIPVAERTGLIDRIALRVIDKSIAVLSEMDKAGKLNDQFYLSINLTTRQVANSHFINTIIERVTQHKVNNHHIQWEITESVFSDNDEMFRIINELVGMGFKVAMDDFGTGYSSLKQLSRLKVSTIKIDRSFVTDIHRNEKNMKLVRAINSIGKSLGMHVVTEGVENEAELNALQSIGIESFQGFYFFKPMVADKFLSMVKQSR